MFARGRSYHDEFVWNGAGQQWCASRCRRWQSVKMQTTVEKSAPPRYLKKWGRVSTTLFWPMNAWWRAAVTVRSSWPRLSKVSTGYTWTQVIAVIWRIERLYRDRNHSTMKLCGTISRVSKTISMAARAPRHTKRAVLDRIIYSLSSCNVNIAVKASRHWVLGLSSWAAPQQERLPTSRQRLRRISTFTVIHLIHALIHAKTHVNLADSFH